MTWSELQSLIDKNNTFLITSHVNPDGDSIGSQMAFHWYLTTAGKRAVVYNADPVPARLSFIHQPPVISTQKPDGPFDVLVVLDSSNLSRLGWKDADKTAATIINIDHHRDNTRFGAVNHVHPGAATGEILYRFFTECDIDFPLRVAEYLYVAIMTDTGGFRFSNTNGGILRICGSLADMGADCARLHELSYAFFSPTAMKLQSRIWSTLAFHLENRVCTMELPLKLFDELGAAPGDSEGMADMTIMADSVTVGMLLKHDERQTHFSLRSRDGFDVGDIARKIKGGGGHTNAAGCTIEQPLERALPVMLGIIRQELRQA